MRVSGEDERVIDLVLVQVVQDSVAVGAVAVPGILQPPSNEQDRKRRYAAVRLTTSTVRVAVSASETYGEYARALTFTTFVQHRENDLLTV